MAAYCGEQLESWVCGAPCDAVPGVEAVERIDNDTLDAHAYVGRWRGQCVLAFRGTDSLNGWMQDLRSVRLVEFPGCSFEGSPCHVGRGFLENFQSISGRLHARLAALGCNATANPVVVTGHSLGAATAALAVFDLQARGIRIGKVYTFGSPRVGDLAFSKAFDRAVAGTPVHRVTKRDDPVVYLPVDDPFHHVGTEVYYPGTTSRGYFVCDGTGEDASCADGNGADGGENLWRLVARCAVLANCGHLTYLQPAMREQMDGKQCRRDFAVLP